MEWVETTGKSLDAAKERALDQLGVAAEDAEFEVLEEPRSGLFGRVRGEARVRARVKPTAVRPKQERRNRGRKGRNGGKGRDNGGKGRDSSRAKDASSKSNTAESQERSGQRESGSSGSRSRQRSRSTSKQKEQQVSTDHNDSNGEESTVTPQEVGDAAVAFMSGLAAAFGAEADTTVEIEGSELDVRVTGHDLGLMVGHGGRTLIAVQDLARVASQRRLGDHETRLRIDVAGYREKRRGALEKFATAVAEQVMASGEAKALEPMQSADRKIVHDVLAGVDGVSSSSQGDDPKRRVIISPV